MAKSHVHSRRICLFGDGGRINQFFAQNTGETPEVSSNHQYVYVVSVMMVVLTSGYMAPYSTGGQINSAAFNMINIIWPLMTVTAIVQIKKKRIVKHRNCMIRSYAFCFTNMLIHLITFMFNEGFGVAYASSYTYGLYGSLVLLLIIPDMIIRFWIRPKKTKLVIAPSSRQ